MRFEWDSEKRRSNLAKHGVDFSDLARVFEQATVTVPDDRFDYAERRFITFGLLHGTAIAIAHTETDETIRFISARKATRNEEKTYFQQARL